MSFRIRAIVARLKGLFYPHQERQELSDEIQEHLHLLTERYVKQGMSPQAAQAAAKRQFGNVTLLHERHFEMRSFLSPTTLWRDITYTLRRMTRSPVFALAAVLSIGLGIGANATIFSMVSKFVLHSAPVEDPANLIAIRTTHVGERCCNSLSSQLYEDLRNQNQSLSGVAAYYELLATSIGSKGEPERIWGQATTTNYFSVAQLPMTEGRGFLPAEENSPVVVLGNGLWKRRFAGDRNILGKSVTLSGHPFTVIGVAPPAFHGLDLLLLPEFWVPLKQLPVLIPKAPEHMTRNAFWIQGFGRLAPGVTRKQAQVEFNLLAQHYAETYPETDKGLGFLLEPNGSLPPRMRTVLFLFLTVLSAVAFLVLCIAGFNVANLLLAQAIGRQHEMSVRLALGATRIRLLRQVLLESLLLALSGGILGVILSLLAVYGLNSFSIPAPVPLDISLEVNWRVLTYSFLLSVGSGIFFGAIPAWIASRPRMIGALKGDDALKSPGRRWSIRDLLVVMQIAMSLILLSATGLFLRSLHSATAIDVGFRTKELLVLSVDPQLHGYSAPKTIQLLSQAQEQIKSLPGVLSCTWTDRLPLSGSNRSDGFSVPGRGAKGRTAPSVELFMATSGYFDTLGIHRLSGRDFGRENPNSGNVAIVNQAFVDTLFPGENPLGQRVVGAGVPYQIIGVVPDSKTRNFNEERRPVLYRSLEQHIGADPSFTGYTLAVHFTGSQRDIANAIHKTIHDLDPNIAIYKEETVEEHLNSALFLPRFTATLFGVFGVIGILLTSVGLYGVMNYIVSRRTREIGIRMALGASAGAMQRMLLNRGVVLTLLAIGVGLPFAWMGAKFANSFLYGIQPHDPVAFLAAPLLLGVVALLACWSPARRASKVNPQTVLKYE